MVELCHNYWRNEGNELSDGDSRNVDKFYVFQTPAEDEVNVGESLEIVSDFDFDFQTGRLD